MIVVYETTTGEMKCMQTPDQPVDAIKDFILNKLAMKVTIKFIFNEKDSLTDNPDDESSFKLNCGYFGLTPNDFHKEMKNPKGHKIRIEGLLLKNRKYNIKIYDFHDSKFYKVSPSYITRCTDIV